jgi:hypothetical protein
MSNYIIPSDAKKPSADSAKGCNKVTHSITKKIGCLSITLRNSSNFEDDEIWAALKEALSHISFRYITRVDVTVTNRYRDDFRGRCYGKGCSMHIPDPSMPLVIARITPEEKQFPQWIDRSSVHLKRHVVRDGRKLLETKKVSSGGYISCWLLDRTECLLYVLSHEFRHLWQMEHKRGRVWGSRGTFSDRDSDAFAIQKVRKYRKLAQRQRSDKALSLASTFFSLPLPVNEELNLVTEDDIENQPINFATEDHLISLLHLENLLGLRCLVKHQSLDYNTLEQYLCCDVIPGAPIRRVELLNSKTKVEDYSA